uniref:Uncharacterized protein n=1 Tax=Oryza nivara TaxID=4536 RepID=A0A0E0HAS0_ORYNI
MDRTSPRGLHLGVMPSGRMSIDANPPPTPLHRLLVDIVRSGSLFFAMKKWRSWKSNAKSSPTQNWSWKSNKITEAASCELKTEAFINQDMNMS